MVYTRKAFLRRLLGLLFLSAFAVIGTVPMTP